MKTELLKLTIPPLYLYQVAVLEDALLSCIEKRVEEITALEPDEHGQIKPEYYLNPEGTQEILDEIHTLTDIIQSIGAAKNRLLEQAVGFGTHAPTSSFVANSPF